MIASPEVLDDLDRLQAEFSHPTECVAVFGSAPCREKPNDIDVLISSPDYADAVARISSLPISCPVARIDMDGYKKTFPTTASPISYHIVVVTSDASKRSFTDRNVLYYRQDGWGFGL